MGLEKLFDSLTEHIGMSRPLWGSLVGLEKLFDSLTEHICMSTPVGVTGGAGEALWFTH